ncbi:MAG: L-serine dehydratase [Chlamydiales bacterium]|jgi:L-serine dehydratase
MPISIFDLFSVGIGPSSSHTVGPMRAAARFVSSLQEEGSMLDVERVQVELYGSLALTGKGHGTDKAILLGLEGELPEAVDTQAVDKRLEKIRMKESLFLNASKAIRFIEEVDVILRKKELMPLHSNGMRFTAFKESGELVLSKEYYSIGGGFVLDGEGKSKGKEKAGNSFPPFPFSNCKQLLAICQENELSISEVMLENEKKWRTEKEIREGLMAIWQVMKTCTERGCQSDETYLPGGLNVRRRAPALYKILNSESQKVEEDPSLLMDWISLYALAVNEENAAGGKVVTAPTNGAAGIIPAVLQYYERFISGANDEGIVTFLLVAGAIGILYKKGASISAAEVGCQGEVGVACSMAAGGLAAVLGGSTSQIENAAEIGMEHNLGLTCDPIGGLVQIPCIERNTMGSIKAVNAARLAIRGDGLHKVSLDDVIKTMMQTGMDMQTIYKETSEGGLAVNVIEC